jgi:hypothetical protein
LSLAAIFLLSAAGTNVLAISGQPWWTESTSVLVESVAVKNGHESRGSFVLTVERTEDGNNFRVQITNPEFAELKGDAFSKQRAEKVLQALSTVYPAYIVSEDGQVVAVEGIEEILDRLIKAIDDPQFEQMMATYLSDPQVLQLMQQKVAESWAVWTSPLMALQLEQNQSHQQKIAFAFFGINVPADLVLENLGSGQTPGSMKLRMTTRSDSAAFLEVVQKMMEGMPNGNGEKASAVQGPKIVGATKQTVAELESDPHTGRPFHASMEEAFSVRTEDGQTKSETRQRTFVFNWD